MNKLYTLKLDNRGNFKPLNFTISDGTSTSRNKLSFPTVNNYPDSDWEATYSNNLDNNVKTGFSIIDGVKRFIIEKTLEYIAHNPCPFFDSKGNILQSGINLGFVGITYSRVEKVTVLGYNKGNTFIVVDGYELIEKANENLSKQLQEWINQCEEIQKSNPIVYSKVKNTAYARDNNLSDVDINLYTTSDETNKSFIFNDELENYEVGSE